MKLFSGVKTLGGIYMGYVKELWGTRTLVWQDGELLKPTQEEVDTAINNAQSNDTTTETPKRKRKAKVEA